MTWFRVTLSSWSPVSRPWTFTALLQSISLSLGGCSKSGHLHDSQNKAEGPKQNPALQDLKYLYFHFPSITKSTFFYTFGHLHAKRWGQDAEMLQAKGKTSWEESKLHPGAEWHFSALCLGGCQSKWSPTHCLGWKNKPPYFCNSAVKIS